MAKTAWKPPMWLIALDAVATILLALGLHMHFAPDSPVTTALPAALTVPLLVVGGMMLVAGMALAVRMVLAHLNH